MFKAQFRKRKKGQRVALRANWRAHSNARGCLIHTLFFHGLLITQVETVAMKLLKMSQIPPSHRYIDLNFRQARPGLLVSSFGINMKQKEFAGDGCHVMTHIPLFFKGG